MNRRVFILVAALSATAASPGHAGGIDPGCAGCGGNAIIWGGAKPGPQYPYTAVALLEEPVVTRNAGAGQAIPTLAKGTVLVEESVVAVQQARRLSADVTVPAKQPQQIPAGAILTAWRFADGVRYCTRRIAGPGLLGPAPGNEICFALDDTGKATQATVRRGQFGTENMERVSLAAPAETTPVPASEPLVADQRYGTPLIVREWLSGPKLVWHRTYSNAPDRLVVGLGQRLVVDSVKSDRIVLRHQGSIDGDFASSSTKAATSYGGGKSIKVPLVDGKGSVTVDGAVISFSSSPAGITASVESGFATWGTLIDDRGAVDMRGDPVRFGTL